MLQGTGRGFPGLPQPREGRPEWQAHDDLCELSSPGAELLSKLEGSDAAGTVGFSALLEQELEPRVKMSGLGLSDSFPYRQLVHSLLHCCPF